MYTEVIITVATVEHGAHRHTPGDVTTKVFRMEFETEEDALNFIDTSSEPRGLLDVQQMGMGSIK